MTSSIPTNPEWFLASRTLDPSRLKKMAVSQATRQDENGLTALIHAASSGNEETVHFLLAKEGNINGPCNYTALMAAVEQNHPGIVHILAPMQVGQRIRALPPKELQIVQNKQTFHNYKSGTTALIIAAEQLNLNIFNYLEKRELDSSDFSACHIAAFKHLLGAVDADMSNAEKPDIIGRIPLFYAVFRKPAYQDVQNYQTMVKQLIPKVQIFDKYGKTALHYAVEYQNVEAVKVLVGWMAGLGVKAINKQYTHGTCAIHIAIMKKNKELFKILKKYEFDCRDGEGKTVDDYAQLYFFDSDNDIEQDDVAFDFLLDVNEINQDEIVQKITEKINLD